MSAEMMQTTIHSGIKIFSFNELSFDLRILFYLNLITLTS